MTKRELYELVADPELPNSILLDAITDLEDGTVASVYIVRGIKANWTGTDSIVTVYEWNAKCFLDKTKAVIYLSKLEEWMQKNGAPIVRPDSSGPSDRFYYRFKEPLDNPFDPKVEATVPYKGLGYYIETAPLE